MSAGFRTSKALGQNFLHDKNIIEKIIASAGNLDNKYILEIGPGMGALSKFLVNSNAKKYVSVEYDERLISHLQPIFNNKNNLLILADALVFDEEKEFPNGGINLIANLPYNISVPLIMKWIKKIQNFEQIIVMVQKEVAERIIAKPRTKAYGMVSILIQYIAEAECLFDVAPGCFTPAPKITSTILKIKPRLDVNITDRLKSWVKLRALLLELFSARRKMIRKILQKKFQNYQEIFEKYQIQPEQRPEEIDYETYYKLANHLNDI